MILRTLLTFSAEPDVFSPWDRVDRAGPLRACDPLVRTRTGPNSIPYDLEVTTPVGVFHNVLASPFSGSYARLCMQRTLFKMISALRRSERHGAFGVGNTPSLDPTAQGRFLKRSEARALMALWEDAVRDVNKVWPFVIA